MSMQTAGQAPRSCILSEKVVALESLLPRKQPLTAVDPQGHLHARPVPRLDWPLDLFRDVLTN